MPAGMIPLRNSFSSSTGGNNLEKFHVNGDM